MWGRLILSTVLLHHAIQHATAVTVVVHHYILPGKDIKVISDLTLASGHLEHVIRVLL